MASTSNNIVTQQHRECCKRNTKQHPRQQFPLDLTKHLLRLQLQNHEILLGLDANLTHPQDTSFWEFTNKTKLIDLFHSEVHTAVPTHQKGNQLNLILGTKLIWENTLCTGVSDSTTGAQSDHSVCFVDIHPDIFSKNADTTSPTLHSVTSKQRQILLKHGAAIDEKVQTSACLEHQLNNLEKASDPNKSCQTADDIDHCLGLTITGEDN